MYWSVLWLNRIRIPISCFAANEAMQPANNRTANSWQYSVLRGLPPYFRTQAFACTPHKGAKSVAVAASNPLFFRALNAESKYGTGVPNGSISIMSKRFFGDALELKIQLASLCLRDI